MRRPQFYIPRIDMWNWRLISTNFVELQLQRATLSLTETDNALAQLDTEVKNIELEIRAKWATGSATVMRAFLARYKEVAAERKRIYFVRHRLVPTIERMDKHLQEVRNSGQRNSANR